MSNDIIKTEIYVEKNKVSVIRINNKEYISLTDLARYANPEEPKIPVQAWMRNKDVISYLGLWEKLNNENFKGHEFETFENEAGKIRQADLILVVRDGKIIEQGRHEELLRKKGYYHTLYTKQFEEEAASAAVS